MITSYFIDNEGTLHTFIEEKKHTTFSNVDSIYHAEMLIEEENQRLLIESCSDWYGDDSITDETS